MVSPWQDALTKSKPELVALIQQTLIDNVAAHGLGGRATAFVARPECVAVVEAYADSLKALSEALFRFDGTSQSAEAISVAALAYRDAQIIVLPQVQRLVAN